ncbi:metallophosphoesterase [Candidatus Sulfurimonas marisnigri]|uniref:Metallophosphoesterase n=1 Tax=Candidatus Sulfurimonas marisnigri TaxID=2740405 RepID=A0A7S7M0C7_9BACT|nr:metallophosphoesterase [Candidatus Sulfurimonas marisnigri]QOY54575.1 metallophosphoesterase [Candidatus Sulfurimonas marisnigri]
MSLQTGWNHFPFEEISLAPQNFSYSLKGLRIVQLSDLHLIKDIDINYLETLVAKINGLNPDFVVITGDILQTSATKLHKHFRAFKVLAAPAYYVTGNHDIVYGPKPLRDMFFDNGVICLDNKIETLTIKGAPLQLVGLSDRYSFARGIKRPIKELFTKIDPNISTILLAHQPKDILHVDKFRIDIQLSGHTHGEQIYPFNIIVKYFQPYFSGLYSRNKTLLYVTRGLEYWGPKVRYRVPSEIPVFTIN